MHFISVSERLQWCVISLILLGSEGSRCTVGLQLARKTRFRILVL